MSTERVTKTVTSLQDVEYTSTPIPDGRAFTCRVCWALVGPLSTDERTDRPNLRRLHAQWHIDNGHRPAGGAVS